MINFFFFFKRVINFIISHGSDPELSLRYSYDYQGLLKGMVDEIPAKRPSAVKVIEALKTIEGHPSVILNSAEDKFHETETNTTLGSDASYDINKN